MKKKLKYEHIHTNLKTPKFRFCIKVCKKCNKKFYAKTNNLNYCKVSYCRDCRIDKGLIKYEKYSNHYLEARKIKLKKDGCCQICKRKQNLIIHHIDCNSSNDELSNLMVLCNQCHLSLHNKYTKRELKNNHITNLFPKEVEYGKYGVRLRYS